jgi:hypothetical protein
MNARSSDIQDAALASRECHARADAYQNAINDLCDSFNVTESELRDELTSKSSRE